MDLLCFIGLRESNNHDKPIIQTYCFIVVISFLVITKMFFFFSYFVFSEYIELTERTSYLMGGNRPIFVKFYSPNCGHCYAMKADFDEAATMFKDVDFGGVDCTRYDKLCREYGVEGYPKIMLFDVMNTTGAIFQDHSRNVDGFCDFIEETIPVKAMRPPKMLRELDPMNFPVFRNNSKCVFVTFYVPWCKDCKDWLPEAKKIAQAYQADHEKITIGELNCELYKGLCHDHDIVNYPTIKLFQEGGTKVTYFNGSKKIDDVMKWINQRCDSERQSDGMLNNTAGTNFFVKDYVEGFINLTDSREIEERINKTEEMNASLYVHYMKRFISEGLNKTKSDFQKMKRVLDLKQASYNVLDNIKKRFNVLSQILGESEFIDPTAPEPEPEEEEFNPLVEDDDEEETEIENEEPVFIPEQEISTTNNQNEEINTMNEENEEINNQNEETNTMNEENEEINNQNEENKETNNQNEEKEEINHQNEEISTMNEEKEEINTIYDLSFDEFYQMPYSTDIIYNPQARSDENLNEVNPAETREENFLDPSEEMNFLERI